MKWVVTRKRDLIIDYCQLQNNRGGGVCLSACLDTTFPREACILPGSTPPKEAYPLPGKHPLLWEAHQQETPPWEAHTPREADSVRHTVNERPVRILLECGLVLSGKTSQVLKSVGQVNQKESSSVTDLSWNKNMTLMNSFVSMGI